MDIASSSQGPRRLATAVEHPRLTKTDAASVRLFLRAYDKYTREVTERARQLTGQETITEEATTPVHLKYCVDGEWLESLLDLNLIEDVSTYEDLEDQVLRRYLETKAEEAKDVVTRDTLDKLVEEELRTDMKDKNARSRIETLFVSYRSLLRRHGVSWILKDNEKVAVSHVLSSIRPESLRVRLESDLALSHHDLRKDFKGFMAHAIKLSEAFQLVDNGAPSQKNNQRKKKGKPEMEDEDDDGKRDKGKANKKAPVCLWPAHKSKGYRHYLKDCTACPEDEKKDLLKALAEEKAASGPARGTRSQTKKDESAKVAGRMGDPTSTSASLTVTFHDGDESLSVTGRADDGSDESIVSAEAVERAVLNGVGKIRKIKPVTLQVALKSETKAQSFTFSRTWTPPRTILKLSAGPLALLNVRYLVAESNLTAEDVLIGLPVLRHFGVDTKTLLEERRDLLDGSDCSNVEAGKGGTVSRLMVARLHCVPNEAVSEDCSKEGDPTYSRDSSVDYYRVREEEDPFPDPSVLDPLDIDQEDAIESGIDSLLEEANRNGMQGKELERLQRTVRAHKNVFRTSFSAGPPAKVQPLKIDLVPDATPVRVRLRNYTQAQRQFLKDFVAQLEKANMAYFNPSSAWACAPLLVPKPGPGGDEFRFTVDLRPINRFTVKHQFPMPNLEQELTRTAQARFFALLDLSHSYWQLPLHEESQTCQSFLTPDGVYTPTRVLHGTTNAVMFLQSTLASCMPDDLRNRTLWWLDDILIFSETVTDHLAAIQRFLEFCVEYNFRLHPGKCTLYATRVRWCGRLIGPEGITFDPRRIDGIRNMSSPRTGSELQQFVCAMQWMRSGIPSFSSVIGPLQSFMEKVYGTVKKRTRRAVTKVSLVSLGWGTEQEKVFQDCKRALENQVTLAHVDFTKRLCVFTDASDLTWAGVVTQVSCEDLSLPIQDQHHEALAFLSGHFRDAELRWSTIEKEAYAIMATVERMHWLLATHRGFDLYTDHNNLVFLFDPTAVVADISQTTLRKVLRWAVRLSAYTYICVHIPGCDNVWADLISRWTPSPTLRRLVSVPVLPSSSSADFLWPSPDEVSCAQQEHLASRPPQVSPASDGLYKTASGAIWIPDASNDLQLRLCVIAHTGPSGHRAGQPTEDALAGRFFWSTLSTDVNHFVRSCVHCLSTVGGGEFLVRTVPLFMALVQTTFSNLTTLRSRRPRQGKSMF